MIKNNNSEFYNNHERLTELIYNNPDMLPSRYVFVLTNLCNLNCSFCFQSKKQIKNAMSFEDWMNVAKQLPDYARVTFTGGEPLLFKEFKEIFSYIATKYDCNLITNGLLLNEKKIDFILSYPRFRVLSISIDDIGNSIRGLNKVQWEYLVSMMKLFLKKRNKKKSSCLLDIKTTILDENSSQIFEIYKYFREEIGCDTHSFQLIKGSEIQHADTMYSFKDILKKSNAKTYKNFLIIKEQLLKVSLYNEQRNKVSYLHPKISTLDSKNNINNIDYINSKKHNKSLFEPCKYAFSSVHINADGNLFPCLAVPMGNVKQDSLKNIIFGNKFKKFKDLIRKEGTIEACNRCGWLKPKNNIF